MSSHKQETHKSHEKEAEKAPVVATSKKAAYSTPCCKAIFKVDQVSGGPTGLRQIAMSPVDDEPINSVFFCGAANGSFMFSVNSDETVSHFKQGGKFEIAFTPVEDKKATPAKE